MKKMNQQSFRRLLVRNIALPLVLGLVTCGVFLGLITQLLSQTARVDNSNKIIASANYATRLFIDAETGLRGFVITGQPNFLQPYNTATNQIPIEIESLDQLIGNNPIQKNRLKTVLDKYRQWINYSETVRLAKTEKKDAAIIVSAGQGKFQMDQIRELFNQFVAYEDSARDTKNRETAESTNLLLTIVITLSLLSAAVIAFIGRKQMMGLSQSYEDVLKSSQDRNEALQKQQWLKTGQTELSEKMVTEQNIASLGGTVVSSVAQYTQANLAAFYIVREDEQLERVGTFAYASDHEEKVVLKFGEGLIGQVAKEKKPIQLNDIPSDYIKVSSGLGDTSPKHIYLFPVLSVDQKVEAVIELAYLKPVEGRTLEFLNQITESIATAISSVQFREQREAFLKEIQNQAEELQTQQEELRVTNEELEEQTRILKEAQMRLEAQHAELEQTNSHLEEQTQALEIQKDLIDQRNDALVEAQASIQKKANELQRASQYKTEFLANMSHELRTPLNSSLILAKLLSDNKENNLTKSQIEFANQIVSSGNDLLNLINDILDLSKVEAGKLDISPEEFAVKRLVDHLEKEFKPVATDKKLALTVDIKPGTSDVLFTDRLRIEQILKNLLSNAIKFTSEGSVHIAVSNVRPATFGLSGGSQDWLRFDVTDTGIGIKKEQQDIIFEAFRQADGTTNRKFGGTGLGLSISKDLARLLGGFITVDSQPGTGSTFSLIIPIKYDEANQNENTKFAPVVSSSLTRECAFMAREENTKSIATAQPSADYKAFIDDDREKIETKDRSVLIVEDDEPFAKILMDLA
ncbi:MAG: CHASE3 domain-containing protein, partial [Bdellovibrio sp.]|nr:CHASE3 domain-containing protein [Bdellovibrio sp.]